MLVLALGRHACCFKNEKRPLEAFVCKVLSGSQRVLLLFDVLYSTCVPFPSPSKECAVSQAQKPSISKTSLDVCHTAHFLISRHRQMLLTMLGRMKSLVETHEAHEVRAVVLLYGHNDLMQHHVWDLTWCKSRPARADDEMSVQEHETTHAPFTHPSASESIPPDVPVACG